MDCFKTICFKPSKSGSKKSNNVLVESHVIQIQPESTNSGAAPPPPLRPTERKDDRQITKLPPDSVLLSRLPRSSSTITTNTKTVTWSK